MEKPRQVDIAQRRFRAELRWKRSIYGEKIVYW